MTHGTVRHGSRARVSAVVGIVLALSLLASPTPASADASSGSLTSRDCREALTALAAAQHRGPAPQSLLTRSEHACTSAGTTLPKAQFAIVTDLDAVTPLPVGLVFAWTDTGSMTAHNQQAPTLLLLEGSDPTPANGSTVSLLQGHRAEARIGGTSYPGTMNAANGTSGQSVVFAFTSPVGRISKPLARKSAVTPREGRRVVVFTDNGPADTTLGPRFRRSTATLNGLSLGVVTLPDGTFAGTSSLPGPRQSSPAAAGFFAHRTVFEPYAGIADTAIG